MKKDFLLDSIQEEIIKNSFHHAILISCEKNNYLEEVANDIARIIFCENHSRINDFCIWCSKFFKHNILSFIKLGDHISSIKKDDVKNLISKFNQTNMEENINKVYVIANAENLNESSSNSLLKFLEEPPSNTYAILLTNDKTLILPTIKSRCRLYNLEFEKNALIENELFYLIYSKQKEELLLFGNKMKKMEKEELVELLKDTYRKIIQTEFVKIATHLVDSINKIRFTGYTSLIIEYLLINIYEGI